MGRATLIGFSAVAMWALLALLTDASGQVPPFLLSAITFSIGTGVGLVARLFMPAPDKSQKIPPQVWLIGIAGLFGYHFFYFTALRNAPAVEASLIAYLWPLLIVLGSVTPWLSASGLVSLTVGGMDGDGKITLVVGILAGLVALAPAFQSRLGLRIAVSVAGSVTVAVAGHAVWSVYSSRDEGEQLGVYTSPGWGLWLTLLAGLVLAAAPWLGTLAGRTAERQH
jgi:drug/metabolite transporter (DMT)-like permease